MFLASYDFDKSICMCLYVRVPCQPYFAVFGLIRLFWIPSVVVYYFVLLFIIRYSCSSMFVYSRLICIQFVRYRYISKPCLLKNHWIKEGDSVNVTEEEAQASISEHISFAIRHLTELICNHSYVISNITMMVSLELYLIISLCTNLTKFLSFFQFRCGVLSIIVGLPLYSWWSQIWCGLYQINGKICIASVHSWSSIPNFCWSHNIYIVWI